jgi:hypothetical protein
VRLRKQQSWVESRPASRVLSKKISTLSRWARGDISAKGQQIADIADRLDATAGAAREDRAIAKDAAEQRLVDIDVLDLVAVHLDRVPGKAGRICR